VRQGLLGIRRCRIACIILAIGEERGQCLRVGIAFDLA
jgi:hypothetical protein